MTPIRHRLSTLLLAAAALLLGGCGGEAPASLEAGTDFTMSVATSDFKAAPGTTVHTDVQFTWVGCPPQDLALEVLGAPAGVSPEFSANPAAVATQLRLRVETGSASGAYPLVLRASRGGLVHTKNLTLAVDAAAPGFSVAVNPGALALDASRPATAQVDLVRTGGFTGAVDYSLVLPPGFTGSLAALPAAPGSAAGADARLLTLQSGSAAPGAYTLRVVASAAGRSASRDLAVTVVPLPAIAAFTALPAAVEYGAGATLQATYTGGAGAVAGAGPLASGGSLAVTPADTTTYTLTVTNALGTTATAAATVTVAPVAVTVTPGSATLNPGEAVSLFAAVTGAVNKAVGWSGNVAASGNTAVFTAPALPGTYTVTATSAAKASSKGTATITVLGPLAQLSAAKATVTAGQGTTLTPVFANGTATLSPALGPLASGVPVATGPLFSDTTYTLTVIGAAGQVATATATVKVVPPPTASLSASATLVAPGQAVVLTPTFANGTPLLAPLGLTGFASGEPLSSGPLNGTTIFVLTVTNPAGDAATASVTVAVPVPPVITSFKFTGPDTVVGVFSGSADGTGRLYDNTNPASPVLLATVASGQAYTAPGPVPEAFMLVVSNISNLTAKAYASNITVTLNEGSTWTMAGRTANTAPSQAFTATLTGSSAGVAWSVAGGADPGSVNPATGLYQPSYRPGTYTLTVAAKADPSKTDSIQVKVVPLFVWPYGQTVGLGHKLILRHALLGAATTEVAWSMHPSTPAGATYGSVDARGVYTSPATVPSSDPLVVATSVSHPAVSVTVPVKVSNAINGGGRIRGTLTPVTSFNPSYAAFGTRIYHTLTTLANGEVLLAGGAIYTAPSTRPRDAYYYRPADQTFYIESNQMVSGRAWATATLLHDGSVLIAGGDDASGNPMATAERFFPNPSFGGVFKPVAGAMAAPRAEHTATLLPDGKVLLAGGRRQAGPAGALNDSAELYDPATDTFTPLVSTLRAPRVWHSATRLLDGRVLVAGGASAVYPSVAISPQSDLFDPATGLFAATGNLFQPVINAVADLDPGGAVVSAGGGTIGFPFSNFQRYDPASGAWSFSSVSMFSGRSRPMGMMLTDTSFLGWGGNTLSSDTADFWVPGAPALDSPTLFNVGVADEGSLGRMVRMLNGKLLVVGTTPPGFPPASFTGLVYP